MPIEFFDYESHVHKGRLLLVSIVVFLVLFYIACVWGLIHFNTQGWLPIFWVLFIYALIPTGLNQLVLLFAILAIYCAILSPSGPPSYRHGSFMGILVVFTILFCAMAYVVTTMFLFILGNTTSFDVLHPELYTEPFLDDQIMHQHFHYLNKPRFEQQCLSAKHKIISQKAVIALLARDISFNIINLQSKVEEIGALFQDYRVVIFENDSQDNTRHWLTVWMHQNPRIILLDCEQSDCRFKASHPQSYGTRSQKRIERLREYREKLLQYALSHFSKYHYYILLDSDISGGLFLKGFVSSFYRNDWDAVFAKGLRTMPFSPDFYESDGFAFLANHEDFFAISQDTTDLQELMNQHRHVNTKNIIDAPWIQCKSGFNGLCIFRMSSLRNCTYFTDQTFRCEHMDLFYSMYRQNHRSRIYMNPSLILFVGHQGKQVMQMFKDILLQRK